MTDTDKCSIARKVKRYPSQRAVVCTIARLVNNTLFSNKIKCKMFLIQISIKMHSFEEHPLREVIIFCFRVGPLTYKQDINTLYIDV